MPAIAGDLVAGVLKGLAEGSRVILGTDKVQKESHETVIGQPLSDDKRADAKRLRDARAKG